MDFDDRTRRYFEHSVISETRETRTVACSSGRTFSQRRVRFPGQPGWRNSNGTATWVGRCPGCHAARIKRYRERRSASE